MGILPLHALVWPGPTRPTSFQESKWQHKFLVWLLLALFYPFLAPIQDTSILKSVDSGKRTKMKTMTENFAKNFAGACVRDMRIELNLRQNVQFYRFRTF